MVDFETVSIIIFGVALAMNMVLICLVIYDDITSFR